MVDHCMAVFPVIDNIRGTGIFKIAMVSLGLDGPIKDDQSYKWTFFINFLPLDRSISFLLQSIFRKFLVQWKAP